MNTDATQSSGSLERLVRPDPPSFEHFPEKAKCPICGTNEDGRCVLIPIAGTSDDGICEAKPIHLACAIPKQWDDGMQMAITWPNYDSTKLCFAYFGFSSGGLPGKKKA